MDKFIGASVTLIIAATLILGVITIRDLNDGRVGAVIERLSK